jgi:HEAT repeat protein
MRRAAWAALAIAVACAHGEADVMTGSAPNRDQEVETQIMLLETPFGDGPHKRERDRAAAWLVEHPDRAYPNLLALLEAGRAGAGVIGLMPTFDRKESIPPLARLLAGPEPVAWPAGQALARHTDPSAGAALRAALASPEPEVAIAAADALATRGDPRDCSALSGVLGARDARVRYHVVQAAATLGCLDAVRLESIARSDDSADVRDLASRLRERR